MSLLGERKSLSFHKAMEKSRIVCDVLTPSFVKFQVEITPDRRMTCGGEDCRHRICGLEQMLQDISRYNGIMFPRNFWDRVRIGEAVDCDRDHGGEASAGEDQEIEMKQVEVD